jgi:hypothetical protein
LNDGDFVVLYSKSDELPSVYIPSSWTTDPVSATCIGLAFNHKLNGAKEEDALSSVFLFSYMLNQIKQEFATYNVNAMGDVTNDDLSGMGWTKQLVIPELSNPAASLMLVSGGIQKPIEFFTDGTTIYTTNAWWETHKNDSIIVTFLK